MLEQGTRGRFFSTRGRFFCAEVSCYTEEPSPCVRGFNPNTTQYAPAAKAHDPRSSRERGLVNRTVTQNPVDTGIIADPIGTTPESGVISDPLPLPEGIKDQIESFPSATFSNAPYIFVYYQDESGTLITTKIPLSDGVPDYNNILTCSDDAKQFKRKLSADEGRMVEDLTAAGHTVVVRPESSTQGQSSPDFYVDQVLTELKTLHGSSLNTPVTKIQRAFKQGATDVIIDARSTDLTLQQAAEAISRARGAMGGSFPGKVEVWTKYGKEIG